MNANPPPTEWECRGCGYRGDAAPTCKCAAILKDGSASKDKVNKNTPTDPELEARAEAYAERTYLQIYSGDDSASRYAAYIDGALAERDRLLSHEEASLLVESNTELERENAKLKNELQNLKELYNYAITKLGKIEDIMEDK